MDKPVIYTIGHSTHPALYFLDLLKAHSVNCLVDIRSVPASSYNPQYNQRTLSEFLRQNGLVYMYFGDHLGARHTHADLLDEDGKVDFEKVRQSADFIAALERICHGIDKGFTIVIMCSESDPLDCHRFSMVSIAIKRKGYHVMHILKDGTLCSNAELEKQLLLSYKKKLPAPDMFNPYPVEEEQLMLAYKLKNKEIAFSAGRPDLQ